MKWLSFAAQCLNVFPVWIKLCELATLCCLHFFSSLDYFHQGLAWNSLFGKCITELMLVIDPTVMHSRFLEDQYTGLRTQTSAPKKHFSSFPFPVVFQQELCWSEVVISHSTMHFFERLRWQKCRQKRKTIKQKDVKVKEETVYKSLSIHLDS